MIKLDFHLYQASPVMASTLQGNIHENIYAFPAHRITQRMHDEPKTPVVLVACGSFSPVTYLHLRMFEMARDYIKQQTQFEVVGGYVSPVNDQYKKPGLLSASERAVQRVERRSSIVLQLTESTCAHWGPSSRATGSWSIPGRVSNQSISPQPSCWTISTTRSTRCSVGLKQVQVSATRRRLATDPTDSSRMIIGDRKRVRIMLLAGSDLINTMSEPGVWSPTDVSPA